MPRKLEHLPVLQYSYKLDTPAWRTDKPKSARTQHFGKHGEVTYNGKRQKGRLRYKGDVVRSEVWCTICFDQGCDRCPPYKEDQNEVQL